MKKFIIFLNIILLNFHHNIIKFIKRNKTRFFRINTINHFFNFIRTTFKF